MATVLVLGGGVEGAAHGGTALGLLLPPEPTLVARAVAAAWGAVPGLVDAWPARVVDGGVRFLPDDGTGPSPAVRRQRPDVAPRAGPRIP